MNMISIILLLNLGAVTAQEIHNIGVCVSNNTCDGPSSLLSLPCPYRTLLEVGTTCFRDNNNTNKEASSPDTEKYLFYDVGTYEGFNFRRDVYMRFAIMLAEGKKTGKWKNWELILPPWYRLYHWRSNTTQNEPLTWAHFFDLDALKSYAPVKELHEIFAKTTTKTLEIDTMYLLDGKETLYQANVAEEWKIKDNCKHYEGNNEITKFWEYKNVTAKKTFCVYFNGKSSKLQELITLHPNDKTVMISNGQMIRHESYGSKEYWDCRKSMKFNKELVTIAKKFMSKHLDCFTDKCTSYISLHWRRHDFIYARHSHIPSVPGTVKEIKKYILKNGLKVTKIFIASDATESELDHLKDRLAKLNLDAIDFKPTKEESVKYKDGGVAIIDQIICSHAMFFIGTYKSTFTFRIEEEREILGFDNKTTFNWLCPDKGRCDRPFRWKIQI